MGLTPEEAALLYRIYPSDAFVSYDGGLTWMRRQAAMAPHRHQPSHVLTVTAIDREAGTIILSSQPPPSAEQTAHPSDADAPPNLEGRRPR